MYDDEEKEKILIVDDISKNIQMIASILKPGDYQMSFARSGKEAIALAKLMPFDLILLDIMMPETDGYEVCEILKEDPETKNIPIIFLTAKTDIESVVKGFEIGAADYVSKPFNALELLARVRTHLKIKKTGDIREQLLSEKEKLIADLKKALDEIDTLRGFIPICAYCKKIRNDENYWEQIDVYLQKHTLAKISHGLCQDCAEKLYPDIVKKIKEKNE